jgi:hypothetical protein
LFVCGGGGNRDRFLRYFTKVFNLRIDDDTLQSRLAERTNNDFGKGPEELERVLRLNRRDDKPAGAIDLDATQPLEQVVDDVLRLADCSLEAGESWPASWSGRDPATVRSFVIPVSALASAEGRRREVVERESMGRIEYAWSGYVLAALLRYLSEIGIDLGLDASVLVLTTDHRERYAARLEPSDFDGGSLQRYYEQLHDEVDAEGAGYAMLDGIAFLRDTLAQLEGTSVAVLVVE